MHDHDQLCLATQTPLHDAPNRYLVVAQDLRDLGEDAGSVVDLEVEVEGHLDVLAIASCAFSSNSGEPPAITETTSPRTAAAVSGPPAPGPDIVISVIAGDSTMTALNGPSMGESG